MSTEIPLPESANGAATYGEQPATSDPEGAPRKPKKRVRTIAIISASAILIAAAAAVTFIVSQPAGPTPIEAAKKLCINGIPFSEGLDVDNYVSVLDDGDTITLRTIPEKYAMLTGVTYQSVVCVLTALDAPESLSHELGKTSANDGRQRDSWDKYEARWSYHPDKGLDIMISSK